MDAPTRDEVLAAFPVHDEPIHCDAPQRGLVAKLGNRNWLDVASAEAFWATEPDPVTWMILPAPVFLRFLPAMLAVALSGVGAAAGNLRGLLYLEMKKGSRLRRIFEDGEPTPDQIRLLDRFLVLVNHGRLPT